MSEEVNSGRLRSIVERIERRESDKSDISDDIKEIYAEAKADGFDTKALRKLVSIRKKDRRTRAEEAEMVELYAAGIGEVLP